MLREDKPGGPRVPSMPGHARKPASENAKSESVLGELVCMFFFSCYDRRILLSGHLKQVVDWNGPSADVACFTLACEDGIFARRPNPFRRSPPLHSAGRLATSACPRWAPLFRPAPPPPPPPPLARKLSSLPLPTRPARSISPRSRLAVLSLRSDPLR